MPRRIDVELTSARPDASWTWRAAGAREPKGTVDASLVPSGTKVGDVLRAEVEFFVDGITIIALIPPKTKPSRPHRLEMVARPEEPGVTSSLVGRRERPERKDRPARPMGAGGRGRRDGDAAGTSERGRRDAPAANRSSPERGATGRPPRPARDEQAPARERTAKPERPGRPHERRAPPEPAAPSERSRPKRLAPANRHRAAVLDSLPPEHRPIADQLLRGGIPAVRRAVEEQNAKNRAEGQPEIHTQALVALAEELLPRLKTAEWRDRAEAAAADVDEISMRDLRSVVVGADAAARDDETRLLASTLREALERRSREQREAWIAEVAAALEEGRLVRALRVSSRPPDPSVRFPADLALRLGEAASAAMASDTPPERWAALLDAVANSPVRRSVKPSGLPAQSDETLLQAARQTAGRVPALAGLLGIDMPPPPGPPRPLRPGQRPPRPGGGPPGRPSGRRQSPAPLQDREATDPIPHDVASPSREEVPGGPDHPRAES